jgi:hypothetical protein
VSRDSEDRTGLGEVMGAWEPSAQGHATHSTELPPRMPPFREVHLAEAGNHNAQLQ